LSSVEVTSPPKIAMASDLRFRTSDGMMRFVFASLNPNSEVGRDGALRLHRAVQARNCVVHDNPICTIPSDR